jgi:hypothetical protein
VKGSTVYRDPASGAEVRVHVEVLNCKAKTQVLIWSEIDVEGLYASIRVFSHINHSKLSPVVSELDLVPLGTARVLVDFVDSPYDQLHSVRVRLLMHLCALVMTPP